MSLFRKPAENKVGAKFALTGKAGTGKTVMALSFPKPVAIDAEMGMSFYEGGEYGKNLIGVLNTQSHRDVQDAMDEISDAHEERGAETLIVDSITKIRENLVKIVTTIDERRVRDKGGSADEANTSVRSWGRVKYVMQNLQNLMLDLSAEGVNVVYVAQSKDVKEKRGDQFVVVGQEMDAQKGMEFDFDVVLYMFTEETAKGETAYKARVLKDRLGVFKKGQVIDSPNYDLWKDRIESRKGETIDTSFTKTAEDDSKAYSQEIEDESKSALEKLTELRSSADKETVAAIDGALAKLEIKDIRKLTAKQTKGIEAIVTQFRS